MNIPCRLALFFLAASMALQSEAAVLVVDSFDAGPFDYSIDPGPGGDTQNIDVLGGSRTVSVSTNRRSTNVTATLDADSSAIVFDTGDGPAAPGSQQGSIFMRWSGMMVSGSINLLGYSAFSISIPMLEGAGWVRVGVNKQSTGTGDTFLPINEPGEFIVPFSSVDTGSLGFEDVRSVHVILTGSTPDFGATIAGVAIVPEPTSAALILLSASVIFVRRNRRMLTSRGWTTRYPAASRRLNSDQNHLP